MNRRETPFPARCYAVAAGAALPVNPGPQLIVSHPVNARPHKPSAEELKRQKLAEMDTAKAIDRVAELLDRLDLRVENYAKLIKHLQRRKAIAEARLERIEEETLTRMDAAGVKDAPGFKRWLRAKAGPPALDVLDETLIPEEYWDETTERKLDKISIKKALQRKLKVPGCDLKSKTILMRE